MSLVGRYRPVAYDPNASTTALGQIAVMTPATRVVAAARAALSPSVGFRNRQNSTISVRKRAHVESSGRALWADEGGQHQPCSLTHGASANRSGDRADINRQLLRCALLQDLRRPTNTLVYHLPSTQGS